MDTPNDQQDSTTTATAERTPLKLFTSKSDILGLRDTQYRYVMVPEWDGQVRVRSITGAERDVWEQSLVRDRKNGKGHETNLKNARAALCTLGIVDEQGKAVFDPTDAPMLSLKSAAAIDRIYEVIAAVSRISDADVEELLGNSKSARSDAQ